MNERIFWKERLQSCTVCKFGYFLRKNYSAMFCFLPSFEQIIFIQPRPEKMEDNLQMTISTARFWKISLVCQLIFHWYLLLRVSLTISQNWFSYCLWCLFGTKPSAEPIWHSSQTYVYRLQWVKALATILIKGQKVFKIKHNKMCCFIILSLINNIDFCSKHWKQLRNNLQWQK